MKPVTPPSDVTIECQRGCGWSRRIKGTENAEEAARYHAIMVHNDQEAVRAQTKF